MTQIQNSFTVSGDLSDYNANKVGQIQSAVAQGANVSNDAVTITVASGSVVVSSTIVTEAATATQTTSTLTNGIFSSTSSLETALATEGATVSVAAITPPTIIAFSPPPALPPPALPPPALPAKKGGDDNIGGIVGGAVGGSCGLIFGLFGYYMYNKKKQQTKVVSTSA